MQYLTLVLIEKVADAFSPLYQEKEERYYCAWLLVEHLTTMSKAKLLASSVIILSDEQEKKLEVWITDHVIHHKPLQYILGTVPFNDLTIFVESPLLIPRPETEEWSAIIADNLQKLKSKNLKILDLCCGTGCIALTLAKKNPLAEIFAVDIKQQAIVLSQKNASYNGIKNVNFFLSDLYSAVPAALKFDCIVANPPYISNKEWHTLDPAVRLWEDKKALIAEDEGYELLERIIEQAPDKLIFNQEFADLGLPQLIVEIGYRQAANIKNLMSTLFKKVHVWKDLNGKERVVTGGW